MNNINTDYLLSQIRTLHAELQSPDAARPAKDADSSGFGAMLKDSLDAVNESQTAAGAMKQAFESGSKDKTLAEVMIASQKANLSFRAMTEVRNKLVTAYQEIMNMPV